MNRNKLIYALLLATSFSLSAKDVKVMQYKHAGPVEVRTPILADSLNVNGKKFEIKDLLKTGISMENMLQNARTLEADTAGFVTLPPADEAYDIHLFSFYLKSDRYVKGNLEVSGPGMFEVYVNGEKERNQILSG